MSILQKMSRINFLIEFNSFEITSPNGNNTKTLQDGIQIYIYIYQSRASNHPYQMQVETIHVIFQEYTQDNVM